MLSDRANITDEIVAHVDSIFYIWCWMLKSESIIMPRFLAGAAGGIELLRISTGNFESNLLWLR